MTVEYCYDHLSWVGIVDTRVTTVDGRTIELGSSRKEFGPFDSSTEVGYWLASQSRALKALSHPDMSRVVLAEDDGPARP